MSEIKMVKLKINGIEVEAPAGEKIIEAAKRVGADVPFFCYHPRLTIDNGANCRMCLVDVAMPRRNPDGTVVMAKMPKPQTACSMPVSDGMEVYTESDQVVKDRRGVLEFMLINHPLDCPICDRGGECPLQNNTLHYGPPTSRYIEEKRHFPKAYPLSDHVVFDRERCIHCARCTRFTQDISGDAQLDFLKRGADMEVGTFAHTNFGSKFSGNTIELCPVGALLSRNYRFKARPWDLMTQKSICTGCSNGCNIKLDYRVGKLQRVNARVNEAVNEEWTCDKGKFGMGYVSDERRLKKPLIRKDGKFVESSWEEANDLIVSKLGAAGTQVGGIGGASSSNEDLYVWQKFFREKLGVQNLDHRMGPHFPALNSDFASRFGYRTMNNSIAELETMKSILIFGSNLVDEQPILFLRVRKAWRANGASVVEIVPAGTQEVDIPNHVGEFASVSLHHAPDQELIVLGGLLNVMLTEKLLDTELDVADITKAVAGHSPEFVESQTGVSADKLKRAARLLATRDLAVLVGESANRSPLASQILAALGNLVTLTGNIGNLNVPATRNNEQGAYDLGILPDSLPGYAASETLGLNTDEMLRAAKSGKLKMLWLVNADLISDFHDTELAKSALEKVDFTVAHAYSLDATAEYADVVLPVSTVAECDGTFTNVERRIQRFHKALEVAPEIHPTWQVFQQISAHMGHFMPYFSARDITREIASTVSIYAGCTPKSLGDEGIRWSPNPIEIAPTIVSVDYSMNRTTAKV